MTMEKNNIYLDADVYAVTVKMWEGEKRVIMNSDWSGVVYDRIRAKVKDRLNLKRLPEGTVVAYTAVDNNKNELLDVHVFRRVNRDNIPPKEEFVDWQ